MLITVGGLFTFLPMMINYLLGRFYDGRRLSGHNPVTEMREGGTSKDELNFGLETGDKLVTRLQNDTIRMS